MLTIPRHVHDAIVAHARADHPDEACGIAAGRAGSDCPERWIPMSNVEHSPAWYRFDPGEQLKVWRGMDDRDEEPVIVYHSHTSTEAWPSRTDVSYASEPDAHYVIVSTRDADGLGEFQFRSFRIAGGVATEEGVRLAPGSTLERPQRVEVRTVPGVQQGCSRRVQVAQEGCRGVIGPEGPARAL